MGWFGNSIGDYDATIHDSTFEYVKDGKPKEYYEKYKVSVYFRNPSRVEVKKEFPLLLFGKIKKRKKYYEFIVDLETGVSKILGDLLFDWLTEQKIKLRGIVKLWVHIEDRKFKEYFMVSEIGAKKIELDNKGGVQHFITTHSELIWVRQNGLEFYLNKD